MAGLKPVLSDSPPPKPGGLPSALRREAPWVIDWAVHEIEMRLTLVSDLSAADRARLRKLRTRLRRFTLELDKPFTEERRELLEAATSLAQATFDDWESIAYADDDPGELAENRRRLAGFVCDFEVYRAKQIDLLI